MLETYFGRCAVEMRCAKLAAATLVAADYGTDPASGRSWRGPLQLRRINSIALTRGTYDAAGGFGCCVGLPTKSGVGGGIMTLCVCLLGLDRRGNSATGATALEHFANLTGHSIA